MTDQIHPEELLSEGAWQPEVRAALLDLITEHGIESPGYDPEEPPLVAIDCDGTLLYNSLAEVLMRHMILRRRFRTDRNFWEIIPERLGRDALQAAYKAVAGRNDAEISEMAAFKRYRAGMFGVYESLINESFADAALFAARMLKGLHERDINETLDEIIGLELERPLSQEDVPGGPPFPALSLNMGIKVHAETMELIRLFDANGFHIWLIDSVAVQAMRRLARRIDFPEDRVLGLELQSQYGMLTEKLIEAVPVGEDKLELFLDTLGRSPVLVIGDSMNDYELLENSEGLSLVMGDRDEQLLEKAEANGWLIQRRLSI
ncbi:haloacid dehalogenase-like hydrolase [Myxococcota bacterium]|nr:haloacid dehalogenase-like hydrolase [Myxococcota bacterium]MBU1431134.1 haloacid dehalogenase-like hydrolase [Myxococcota bacterium]MBU1899569.1 haloacid dehalogenase-like hydrolase [Myxococcota bacterium]